MISIGDFFIFYNTQRMSAKKFLKKILTGIFILSLIGNNFFYVFAQSVDT